MDKRRNQWIFGGIITGAFAGVCCIHRKYMQKQKRILMEKQMYIKKNLSMFKLMNEWMRKKQQGKSIYSFFQRNQYRRIAIYGMGDMGERLYDELYGTGIEVAYGIEQQKRGQYRELKILSLEDDLEQVDAVVVTAFYYFVEIAEKIKGIPNKKILDLEDIIYDL